MTPAILLALALVATPLDTVRVLAREIGPRPACSMAEVRAADWLAQQLRDAGYTVTIQEFDIPGKGRSRNVIGRIGVAPWNLVCAHFDTKRSPGADDNGSGCAVVLEVAQRLSREGIPLMIVFTGAEEMQTRRLEDHHYGSRFLAASLAPHEIRTVTNIDMVGLGPQLCVRGLGNKPDAHARALLTVARRVNPACTWVPDRTGLSDHEAFARRGWPHAWLERRPNESIHTPRDTEVNAALLDESVLILQSFLDSLGPGGLIPRPPS